ncbi:protein of unknown function [Pararobbsia alpina]
MPAKHSCIWLASVFCLVPTARLELAQLSPLPPQDSVSTNFTTSASVSFYPLACIAFALLASFRAQRFKTKTVTGCLYLFNVAMCSLFKKTRAQWNYFGTS